MSFILEPTVTRTFLKRVQTTPDVIGFCYKPPASTQWREVTFRQFYDECKIVSYGLMGLGIAPGDRVTILSLTRYEWSLCDLAILGAGGVTVPIYPSSTADDIEYILNHSESKVIILENSLQLQKIFDIKKNRPDALPHLKKIILIDTPPQTSGLAAHPDILTLDALKDTGRIEEPRDPARFEYRLNEIRPDDLLTICYTSGTTGIPKGAMLTHDSMMSVLEDCVAAVGSYAIPNGETILSFLPFSHILGKVESMAIYTFGWRQHYAESLDKIMTNIREVRPTVLFAVPRIFEKARMSILAYFAERNWLEQKAFARAYSTGKEYHAALWSEQRAPFRVAAEYALEKNLIFKKIYNQFGGRLRFAICGGAPLPQEIGEFFEVIGIKTLEGYGLTETCAPITMNTPEHTRFGTVGRPLQDVSIKIAEDGEILVKSRKVFKGYYKAIAETSAALDKGWLKTGDIGFIDSDGYLHITDRKKDIIITSGGKNIAPQKIENLAKSHPYINQLVVHGDGRHYLSALITLNREEVIKYASENHILFSEYSELIKHPKILALVQGTLDEINAHLANYETIKKFNILPHEFSVESGELTPSLKVRRHFVDKKYRAELDNLYSLS